MANPNAPTGPSSNTPPPPSPPPTTPPANNPTTTQPVNNPQTPQVNIQQGPSRWDDFKDGVKNIAGAIKSANRVRSEAVMKMQAHSYDFILLAAFVIYASAPFWRRGLLSSMALHFTMLMIVFATLDKAEKDGQYRFWVFGILAVEIGLPALIYYNQSWLQGDWGKWIVTYLTNPYLTLGWFYFAIFRSKGRTMLTKWVGRGMYIIWLAIIVSFFMTNYAMADIQTPFSYEQQMTAVNLYTDTVIFVGDTFTNLGKISRQGTRFWYQRMYLATGGDYYTGRVDESQQETLGVFIENMRPSDSQYYKGDVVTVWSVLEAETLDDGLNITVSCYHGRKDDNKEWPMKQRGITNPKSVFVYDQEALDVDCRFANSKSMEESSQVTVVADFHFETMSYLATYFMDKDRLRSTLAQGLDPLEEWGIEDKKPIAKYSNGPVSIGIGTIDPPIGVQDKISSNPALGVTLDTNIGWNGFVKQLEELTIMVPDSMSLDIDWCTEFEELTEETFKSQCQENYVKYRSVQLRDCVRQIGLNPLDALTTAGTLISEHSSSQSDLQACMEAECDKEIANYNVYKLKIDDRTKLFYSNFGLDAKDRGYKTFSCGLKLDNPDDILGDVPVAMHNIRAKARYTYQIEESININLKDPPADYQTTSIPPDKSKVSESLSFVFSEFFKQAPYIEKYCTASGLFGDVKECACMIMSIMSQESGGRVDVGTSIDGANGLMQIMPGTAQGVWDEFQSTGPCDLHEPECAIRTATYHFVQLARHPRVNDNIENVIAQYHCGSALKIENRFGCTNTLRWKCGDICIDGNGAVTQYHYVPKVKARYDSCLATEYVESSVVKEPTENYPPGTLTLNFKEDVAEDFIPNTPYKVRVVKGEENGKTTFYIGIYYNKQKDAIIQLATVVVGDDRNEVQPRDLPFIKLKYAGENKLGYQFIEKAISEEIGLDKNKVTYPGGVKTPETTEVFKDWFRAWYDGDIHIYNKDNTKVCTIPWATYTDRETGYCEDEDLFMMKVVNIKTTDQSTSVDKTLPEKAVVQVQIDINRNNECCNDCKKCAGTGNPELLCSSCDKCVTAISAGEFLSCSEGTPETWTPISTPTAVPNCCDDCSKCEQSDCEGTCYDKCQWENIGGCVKRVDPDCCTDCTSCSYYVCTTSCTNNCKVTGSGDCVTKDTVDQACCGDCYSCSASECVTECSNYCEMGDYGCEPI